MNSIVAIPIAAAIPTAAPSLAETASIPDPHADEPADPVIEMAERAIAAWNAYDEKCDAESKAEEAVIDWQNLNPVPEMRPRLVGNTEDYLAFQAGKSTYDPNADLRAANAEHQEAVKKWRNLRRQVEKDSGYKRAERAKQRACDRVFEILNELCDLHPISVAGLRAKARVARLTKDDNLIQQLAYDVDVLFRDLSVDGAHFGET